MGVISHWGAEIEAQPDWLGEEPALSILRKDLLDAFEQWDLAVNKAHIHVQAEDVDTPHLVIRVTAKAGGCFPDGAPREMPKSDKHIHPDNGCPYGVVEQVMLT
jgi:hypothetical protein